MSHSISLEQANQIIQHALAHAHGAQMKRLCVAVLDTGGHLIALQREDGASILRPQIAQGKARGAINMGFGGRELARRAVSQTAFLTAMASLTGGDMVPVPGGVLVRNAQGELLGAVGITGDTSDNDEACAIAGVNAVGLVADVGVMELHKPG